MSEMSCMKCRVLDFKESLCEDEFCKMYYGEGNGIDFINAVKASACPTVPVDDLISRQAAIDETWKEPSYTDPYNVLTEVRERIQSLPSAQSEIIRCKDCKHYYFADNRVLSEQSWVCDAWGVDQTAHMGYCFKAERKDNE